MVPGSASPTGGSLRSTIIRRSPSGRTPRASAGRASDEERHAAHPRSSPDGIDVRPCAGNAANDHGDRGPAPRRVELHRPPEQALRLGALAVPPRPQPRRGTGPRAASGERGRTARGEGDRRRTDSPREHSEDRPLLAAQRPRRGRGRAESLASYNDPRAAATSARRPRDVPCQPSKRRDPGPFALHGYSCRRATGRVVGEGGREGRRGEPRAGGVESAGRASLSATPAPGRRRGARGLSARWTSSARVYRAELLERARLVRLLERRSRCARTAARLRAPRPGPEAEGRPPARRRAPRRRSARGSGRSGPVTAAQGTRPLGQGTDDGADLLVAQDPIHALRALEDPPSHDRACLELVALDPHDVALAAHRADLDLLAAADEARGHAE